MIVQQVALCSEVESSTGTLGMRLLEYNFSMACRKVGPCRNGNSGCHTLKYDIMNSFATSGGGAVPREEARAGSYFHDAEGSPPNEADSILDSVRRRFCCDESSTPTRVSSAVGNSVSRDPDSSCPFENARLTVLMK
jgi:hypothetical protein